MFGLICTWEVHFKSYHTQINRPDLAWTQIIHYSTGLWVGGAGLCEVEIFGRRDWSEPGSNLALD